MSDPLLQPFQLKHLTLRNRVFSSAHEPAYGEGGMPTDRYRLYHEERAKGGVALTMTAGSAVVARDSPPAFGNLHAFDDAIVPWIQRLTDGVHEHGAACMIQITHLGRRAGWSQDDWLPIVAPSPIREPAHRGHPKEAEDWDIDRIIADYADAAERMAAGGMDGIEIQSYGHFFDTWWSPATNTRDDEFGGLIEAQMAVPMQILRAVRDRVGPEFILGLRMAVDEANPAGLGYERGLEILRHIDDADLIDFVNVIRGHIDSDAALAEVIPLHGSPSAPHLDFAGEVRSTTDLAILHASKIDDVATARFGIAEGKLDMVGMTRAQIADPHLVNKIRDGKESTIRPCVGATYCLDRIYEAGEALCIHNPATGREATMPHEVSPAEVPKRVVVVGAGPGGLEAARVAGERGHEVVVFDAMPRAGGQIRLATRNKRRIDLIGIIDWRLSELDRLGVSVHLGTVADRDTVLALEPDVVVIATGGSPQLPPLEAGHELVSTAWDVIAGDVRPKGRVLLYDDDGTHHAMTAAELLAESGVDLEIVTPERMYGVDVGGMNAVAYARAMNEADVRITLHQRVVSVARQGDDLVVQVGSDHSSVRHERRVDHVIVAHGTEPEADVYFELKADSSNRGAVDYGALIDGRPQTLAANPDGKYQLFRIGDAVESRNIHAAIYDALRLVKDL
ncbi:MAG: NADH:flavin oxidoreductase [Actinomycetia bacterium]|nr:NADH:flavin oxidoreductase [Actinomycetes bacterium]